MRFEEKLFVFLLGLVFILWIASDIAFAQRRRMQFERIDMSVKLMKIDLGITHVKDSVRDAWMWEHDSELMKRIEERERRK